MPEIRTIATSIKRNEKGNALLEFALALPFLLLLLYGAVELSRYVQIMQHAEKTISTITDIITQASSTSPINPAGVEAVFDTTPDMMYPYMGAGSQEWSIVTDVLANSKGVATIEWQCVGGSSNYTQTSKVGVYGSGSTVATLPGHFTMVPGEEAVIGELFYGFNPIMTQNVVTGAQIYRTAVYAPRYESLATGSITAFTGANQSYDNFSCTGPAAAR